MIDPCSEPPLTPPARRDVRPVAKRKGLGRGLDALLDPTREPPMKSARLRVYRRRFETGVDERPSTEEIRAKRKQCGLSQTQAARLIGVTRETWSGYERDASGRGSINPVLWKVWLVRAGLADPSIVQVQWLPKREPA